MSSSCEDNTDHESSGSTIDSDQHIIDSGSDVSSCSGSVDVSESDDEDNDKQVILQRLVDLHKELKNVRVRAATSSEDLPMELPNAFHHDASNGSSEQLPLLSATMSSPSAGISAQNSARKLIVCSLRRPVKLERNAAEHSGWTFTRSTGGFQAGMDFIARHATVHWVSWPGCVVDPTEQEAVREKLEHFHQTSPVYMDTELVDRYFYFYCGRILWPAMHNSLSDTCDVLEQSSQGWDAYQTANRLFLDALATVYNPGDVILVHDFQLMLLPSMIRQRWRDAPVCFFLQCPFPSEEIFRCVSAREHLLRGVLGADLVLFHHFDYVRQFMNATTQLLGLETCPKWVVSDGRLVSLAMWPLGISLHRFRPSAPGMRGVPDGEAKLRASFQGKQVIVGMDRLDFCKGILHKLGAYEQLLERYPEFRGKVLLVEIVRDSGRSRNEMTRALSKQVNQTVGRVNGRFGDASYCPVHFIKHSIPFKELVAVYRLADVVMCTSIKEGVNLAAQEFVSCQSAEDPGVLMYSEFAGCASFMDGAVLVNPYHQEEVAAKLHKCLTMSPVQRRTRLTKLEAFMRQHTASIWAKYWLAALNKAKDNARTYTDVPPLETHDILATYAIAHRRLICLDYDGTLSSYRPVHELSTPSVRVIAALAALASDPMNVIFIISGHTQQLLQRWFGGLPIGIAGEHGYIYRMPPAPDVAMVAARRILALIEKPHGSAGQQPHLREPKVPTTAAPRSFEAVSQLGRRPMGASALHAPTALAPDTLVSQPLHPSAGRQGTVPSFQKVSGEWERVGDAGDTSASGSARAGQEFAEGILQPAEPQAEIAHERGNAASSTAAAEQPWQNQSRGASFDQSGVPLSSEPGLPASLQQLATSPGYHSWQVASELQSIDTSWIEEVAPIVQYFQDRTPGAVTTIRSCTITWSYRDADTSFGATQARDLQLAVQQILFQAPLEVIRATNQRYLIIRPLGVNKGVFVRKLRAADWTAHWLQVQELLPSLDVGGSKHHTSAPTKSAAVESTGYSMVSPQAESGGRGAGSTASGSVSMTETSASGEPTSSWFDFMLVIGDERTDEDMYPHATATMHAFTITVGRKASAAMMYASDPVQVLTLLEALGSTR